MRVIYDLETYPNCFTFCCFVGGFWVQYEISDYRDDGDERSLRGDGAGGWGGVVGDPDRVRRRFLAQKTRRKMTHFPGRTVLGRCVWH